MKAQGVVQAIKEGVVRHAKVDAMPDMRATVVRLDMVVMSIEEYTEIMKNAYRHGYHEGSTRGQGK